MRENVGGSDALVRSVVGIALAYAAMRAPRPRWSRAAALTLGTLLVESAITRVCPVNHLLGLDTREARPRRGTPPELSARAPLASDWDGNAADLEPAYADFAAFQRPPADS